MAEKETIAEAASESSADEIERAAKHTLDKLDEYEEECFVWANVDLGEINDPDPKSGTRHHLKFEFPLVTSPHRFQPPDLSFMTQNSKSMTWVNSWLIESGLLFQVEQDQDNSLLVERMKDISNGFVYGFSRMGIDSSTDKKAQAIIQFSALAILTDDAMEESEFLGINNFSSTDVLMQLMMDIIEGKILQIEDIPETIPIFNQLLKATYLTIDQCRKNFPEYGSKCGLVAEFFYPVAYAVMFLHSSSNRGADNSVDPQIPEDTFRYLRRYDVGLTSLIELVGIMQGITLPEMIRRNLLFKRVLELAGSIASNVNDIFSVKKELMSSEGLGAVNLVFYKVRHNGNFLKEAFKAVIASICGDTENIVYLIHTLRNLYPDNEDLDKYLTIVETFVDACTHWSIMSPRYGNCKGTSFTVRRKGEAIFQDDG